MRIEAVNDFVIRFANVNGTGSASANNMFSKAVFRMGVPVSPKNIFPSNIQGLPTWFEVRVTEKGHLGSRGDVDFVVAINGQTMRKDYDSLLPGGYFLFDSTKALPRDFKRDDIIEIGIPLTQMCIDNYTNPRQRQLFKNIIYVGALAYLFDMEFEVLTNMVKDQFAKKEKLIPPNIGALELGYNYAKEHYPNACGLKVQRRDNVGDSIIIDGNSAAGLGAVYGGATVVGWYPITPSTSVVEAFEKYAKKFRIEDDTKQNKFAIIQAEDELAAIGMAIGANWNGARAFTATSGPGVSLMSEFLGLAYFAEIPVVLMDIQRSGPSTGMPTRTQQSDVISAAYASHGDTKQVLLIPCDPAECFEMSATAFDLADRLQTPVILLSDLDLGMNDHMSRPLIWDDERKYDRGKVLTAEDLDNMKERWGRYKDVDGDGIGYRTYPGTHPTKGSYFTRGSSHDDYAAYTEDSGVYEDNMQRLVKKWDTAKDLVPKPQIKYRDENSKVAAIFYGTSAQASYEALDGLEAENIKINTCRIKSFPFHPDIKDFIEQHDTIFVIEQNRDAQMRTLLINEFNTGTEKLQSILNIDGMPIRARRIKRKIERMLNGENVNPFTTANSGKEVAA
ncbi:2-oxoacid:acceptor oxidoreductase subunit alpha [Aliikangiella coralliicola]|uniref:2-oxoacid:acceptor oxidoreductase subunit alpha n=1 Tax=Aliikangiella coralliicola TaxID=2592383 RepID=A0A545UGR1_9GAMM|nr:2-oxoacid:acceptor oxidoreductase subunit alpha [Aliikangiella coralliicola]TQV88650.1 2-oxoacid:acceptor oxidoreductase subunit alpha [Aliikangiella coralliicola]